MNQEFAAGDVVFGLWPGREQGLPKVLRHFSVVLAVLEGGLLLGYTTSLKVESSSSVNFTDDERVAAGFPKPCRFDPTSVALVPFDVVKVVGRLPHKCFLRVRDAHTKAMTSRNVSVGALTEDREVVFKN